MTKVGLKPDGKALLEYLNEKGICIDLSHTSDALADNILNYIDKKGLKITPIASHSTFRTVCHHPRTLPDNFAKDIIRRDGLIGLNFVKAFIGKKCPDDFMRQVDYAYSLDALNHFCFGADFFYEKDMPIALHPFIPFFYNRFGDSSCYPDLLDYLGKNYPKAELEQIAYKNFANFLQRMHGG